MQHCLASRNVARERLGFHELDITPSSRRVSLASRAKRAKRAAAGVIRASWAFGPRGAIGLALRLGFVT